MDINDDTKYPLVKNGTIILKIKNEYQVILIEKIAYCVADGSYTTIILECGSEVFVSKSLYAVGRSLKSPYFIKCHHDCLVNIKKVLTFNKELKILTVLDHNIHVSRRKCAGILEKLKSLNDQL